MNAEASIVLRGATPGDIPALEAIAWAAKAHWGYSPAQMDAWRHDLQVPADSLGTHPACVAEVGGQPIGFAQLGTDTRPWELAAMWVSPSHMGRGVGKALLAWARAAASAAGQDELAIDADPNAERFYEACGARRVGSVPAPIEGQPRRFRPQLRLRARPA